MLREQYSGLKRVYNERNRRLWAESMAYSLSRGGISILSEATEMARKTVKRGLEEFIKLKDDEGGENGEVPPESERIRAPGGVRKSLKACNLQESGLRARTNLIETNNSTISTTELVWCFKWTIR